MIVADTNVLVYLAMPSSYTEAAERLFVQDPNWVAPMLWRDEFRNALALYLRKGLIDLEQALEIQAEMESLLQQGEYVLPSREVLSLASQTDCSVYDCQFVALAKGLGVPLVTMDRRLVSAFPETAVLLTDFVA